MILCTCPIYHVRLNPEEKIRSTCKIKLWCPLWFSLYFSSNTLVPAPCIPRFFARLYIVACLSQRRGEHARTPHAHHTHSCAASSGMATTTPIAQTPEFVEDRFGEAINAREQGVLPQLAVSGGFGPPDLCWMRKITLDRAGDDDVDAEPQG